MNQRIQQTFQRLQNDSHPALVPYLTAGDPHPKMTVSLMHALADAGADIIELGIPFSDPMADGPVIQRACERAVAKGLGLLHVLEMVTSFRQTNQHTPVILMGYLNPIERMGYQAFAKAAEQAGVDGVILVDLPPEAAEDWLALGRQHQIDTVFLVSPTTADARMQRIAQDASGFLYYVSMRGVTGGGSVDLTEVQGQIARLKQHTHLPVVIGFGIRDAQTAQTMSPIADGVVMGSALVQLLEPLSEQSEATDQLIAQGQQLLTNFLKPVKKAITESSA